MGNVIKEFHYKIFRELLKLNTKSPYYRRLTAQVFNTEIVIKQFQGTEKQDKLLPLLMNVGIEDKHLHYLILELSTEKGLLKLFYKSCYLNK